VRKARAVQRAQNGLVLSLLHTNGHNTLSLHAPSLKIISSTPSAVRLKYKQFLLALFVPWHPHHLCSFTAETNLSNTDCRTYYITYSSGQKIYSSQQAQEIFFSSLKLSTLAMGPTQPPIQSFLGAPSPRVKQLGDDNDHILPPSAKIKELWRYTSIPPYAYMAKRRTVVQW
jgi:hypothetical protein